MAAIQLKQVTKVFNTSSVLGNFLTRKNIPSSQNPEHMNDHDEQHAVLALNNVDFHVPDGQTTVVVGPSGCGKSTLLRTIAGLIDYQGDVYYNDRLMNDIPVKDRRIGMVFQNYALYPHFYGHGNLSFFFKVNKAPDAEAEERIRYTSEMMGIGFSDLLKRKPGTLSGGQQQRVAIGRAIVRKPDLFLFDEPLSNLDAKLRAQTRVEIKRLLHRFNITSVYVTHDQSEALALGDEIAVMRNGRIEQVGTYQHIISHPVNQFVAGFLGLPPMNIFEAEIDQDRLNLGGTVNRLPEEIRAMVGHRQRVNVGIRPESIIIGQESQLGPDQDAVRLKSMVEVLEPDFGRSAYTAYLRHDSASFCALVPLDSQIHAGYPCDTSLPVKAMYLFDADSGLLIGKCKSPAPG
ncbi:MAG: ABC transporter ATP-binding protein [Anaerolineae bacterium]|nr:ABC transporter ATP-binding protein [Anaerolineae bacterium]